MQRPVLLALVILLITASGCASTGGVARPQPFPGAPPPPEPTFSPARLTPTAPGAPKAADALVDTALSYRGIPYVLGGEDPRTGFDCSGLVQFLFARYSVDVPRTVADQFRIGIPVGLADLRAADLVFFSTTGPGPTHVGIAVSRDQFIHAPTTNGVVRVEPVDSTYWHERFVGARRVF
jgi:cell wall-associated NlpC family hydrolase